MRPFPFYQQLNAMDCGPTCLRMVAKYYGKNFSMHSLRAATQVSKDGVNLLGISEAAEKIGLRTRGIKIGLKELIYDAPKPAILHWNQNHFVVLPPQKNKTDKIIIADPDKGTITMPVKEFLSQWASSVQDSEKKGIALILEATPLFYEQQNEIEDKVSWTILFSYLRQQKRFIFQLILGLVISSLLQLIFPFLTQSIVDTGIDTHNIEFIYIILIAQFMLFFSRTIVEFIRSRILLYMSTRINISLLSDFWAKLMRLPVSFFDTKQTGDILQRIQDERRIENFLTASTLSVLFSLISLFAFSIVLLLYNALVFYIFCIASILYLVWIRLFLKPRRNLDYKRFAIASKENSTTMQLIYGMHEIKLNNAERSKRWEWEGVQASLYKVGFRSLSLSQYQQAGAFFINEGKNIIITFFVAKAVLGGQLTFGAMLAIQYIIGQLTSPIEQLLGFIHQSQDAKISLERINEIYGIKDEEDSDKFFIHSLPLDKSIHISNLSFTYTGAGNKPILKNIGLVIKEGKTTAIVGASGSGKTTLLKLILQFYSNYSGEINIGGNNLSCISPKFLRSQCGIVMQDGFIFSDTIAKNIAINDDDPDYARLAEACKVANILSFIQSLPLTFSTKIGAEGNNISAGQKQRILIARAVYKNPHYLLFDEATNALDTKTEREIMGNMQEFFKGKTVIIVAHRLSTVRNADNIIVLTDGVITEQGAHEELTQKKGQYFQLVQNQLELEN